MVSSSVSSPSPVLSNPFGRRGLFFSAAVEAKVGADTWRVKLDGRSLVVTTTLDLVPGQTLRLRLVSQEAGRWVFETVPRAQPAPPAPQADGTLMAAFVSRGLPVIAEKLAAWTRWLGRTAGPVDKDSWAASLEARGQGPGTPLAAGLEPWLAWQEALEGGRQQPTPDEGYWDLWNSRRTASGEPWLVTAVRWVHEDQQDAGLLQAHWNPQAQAIDRWNFTAAPEATPFRLEVWTRPGHLELHWHFFEDVHRRKWEPRADELSSALSSPDLRVTLKVRGRPEAPFLLPKGVHVEA